MGVHLVLEHPPLSIKHIINNQTWIAAQVGFWGLAGLKKEVSDIPQDGFDSLSKLKTLTTTSEGLAIIISTNTDTLISSDSTRELFGAIAAINTFTYHIERDATNTPGIGHGDYPLEDDLTWKRYSEIIQDHIDADIEESLNELLDDD